MKLFANMSLRARLWSMGAVMLIVVAVLAGLHLVNAWRDMARDQREIHGITQTLTITEVMRFLPAHRGLTNTWLSGDTSVEGRIQELTGKIDAAFAATKPLASESVLDAKVLDALIAEWGKLKGDWRKMDGPSSFLKYNELVEAVQKMIRQIGDRSGLTHDNDEAVYHLAGLLTEGIPTFVETAGQARGLGAGLATKGEMSPEAKGRILALRGMMRSQMGRLMDTMRTLQESPAVKLGEGELKGAFETTRTNLQNFMGNVDWLLENDAEGVDAGEYFKGGSDAIEGGLDLATAAGNHMRASLEKRKQLSRTWMMTLSAISLLTMAGLALLLTAVVRRITQPLAQLNMVLDSVRNKGDLAARVVCEQRDEIGRATCNLNATLDAVQSALRESQEVAGALAIGDFSRRIEGDYTGDLSELKRGINGSAESMAMAMNEVGQALTALRNGQFNTRIESKALGRYGEMAREAAATMTTLRDVIADVNRVMGAVSHGEFTHRVSSDCKGDLAALRDNLNDALDTLNQAMSAISLTVSAMADGDLTARVQGEYGGDLFTLKGSVNTSIERMGQAIAEVAQVSHDVHQSAEEIAKSSQDLSNRTQGQAAAIEETAASTEEMASTVQQNAENTKVADKLSNEAQIKVEEGSQVMHESIAAMDSMRQAAGRISEIISLIDGIAFQTNILALNAAVEAARAGEHGRGFAVVASEVRSLAQKSADAAKDIKELIATTTTRIDQGAKLVEQSGKALGQTQEAIKRVTNVVAEIASASREQALGLSQINSAVSSMDQATQANAALVEETEASAITLRDRAADLSQMAARFKISTLANHDTEVFSKARSAHLAWRARLRDFLDGKSALTQKEAVSHRDCVLGKWLYSTGLRDYGHLPSMPELEHEHEKMHGLIRHIMQLQHDGDSHAAENNYNEFDQLSQHVVHLIDNTAHEAQH